MLRIGMVLISSFALSGCVGLAAMGGSFLAADEMGKGAMGKSERRTATIEALGAEGENLVPRYIEIEEVEKNDGSESWTAETAIGNYRCTVITGRSDATCAKLN